MTERISFTTDIKTKEKIVTEAKKQGLTIASYVRQLVLKEISK